MIRTIAIAATAAILLAAPARAEQSIHISTVGKSVEQVKLEVRKAANTLCWHETRGATFPLAEMQACVEQTVKTTFAKIEDPALKLAAK